MEPDIARLINNKYTVQGAFAKVSKHIKVAGGTVDNRGQDCSIR